MTDSSGPLASLRVLELSTLYAAPLVGTMLSDFGADVVKVEPPNGDPLRNMLAPDGTNALWDAVARNKRSIVLDLDDPKDRGIFADLEQRCDVLVENLLPARREQLDLTPAAVQRRHPQMVHVSVTCFGIDGPAADRPGAGTLAEAFGGLTYMTGEVDGPPMLTSLALGDVICAYSAVIGVLIACFERAAGSGLGQHVDASMYEPILGLLTQQFAERGPDLPAPSRQGNRLERAVLRNLFETADNQHVAISCSSPAQASRLIDLVIGESANAGPSAVDEEIVRRWVGQQPLPDVLAMLARHRIPHAAVNSIHDVMADGHVRARGSVRVVESADGRRITLVEPFPRLSRTPGRSVRLGPALDGHREEVLRDWLTG